MKKSKKPIYLRYEFSDESGRPEGGDIFEFSSLKKVIEMTGEIMKVAHSDGVAVNLTIGEDKPFFSFLQNVGVSRKDAEAEMVAPELATEASPKGSKKGSKTTKKKTARKSSKKSSKKTSAKK